MGNVFKIVWIYVGIIIGAGFASGKEITSFFVDYGPVWIIGILFAGFLFAFLGAGVLDIVYKKNIQTYEGFLYEVMGQRVGKVMDMVTGAFLCVLFCTMIAAAGAMGKETFHLTPILGKLIMLSVCFIVFLWDKQGIIVINSILSPCIMVCGILIGIYTIYTKTVPAFLNEFQLFPHHGRWIFSSVLYVSYNIITAVSVLISLRSLLTNRWTGIAAGILGGFMMALLGVAVGIALFYAPEDFSNVDIPLLNIVTGYGTYFRSVYIFMLLAAIFTTAVGNGFGALAWLKEKLKRYHIPNKILIFAFICASACLSSVGFSDFVGKIYPLFGYLGLIEIFFLSVSLLYR